MNDFTLVVQLQLSYLCPLYKCRDSLPDKNLWQTIYFERLLNSICARAVHFKPYNLFASLNMGPISCYILINVTFYPHWKTICTFCNKYIDNRGPRKMMLLLECCGTLIGHSAVRLSLYVGEVSIILPSIVYI